MRVQCAVHYLWILASVTQQKLLPITQTHSLSNYPRSVHNILKKEAAKRPCVSRQALKISH
jgi:hypothetical protein